MKKLTNKAKIEILKEAKEYIMEHNEGICVGICRTINNRYFKEDYTNGISTDEALDYFPELKKYKPKVPHGDNYWFDFTEKGMEKRYKIINKIIKQYGGKP